MAFLEWRKFTFFDLHRQVDKGKIAECLQDTTVSVATSGNSHVVLCDTTGWAHIISRSWAVTSFKAYELSVTLAYQFPHDPYLVTIGEDEPGVNPLIRVWDWSRSDRHGNPTCAHVSRAVPSHLRPTPATALAAHDNKNLLAVGFHDGSVTLFRGDITRQRTWKMKTLSDSGPSPITALAFKGSEQLFVVSRAYVSVHSTTAERCVSLDSTGAAPACAVLADRQQLMVARPDAIYCYTTEGRGPCYALEGEKVRLNWFRSYLVITTNETVPKIAPSTSEAPPTKSHHITILDIQNKFIIFSKTFEEISAVLTEWGSFYILTSDKELIYLDEKDLQSKMQLLFKKNLYDVALRMASSQQYDAEGLTEICKQYGDHLYAKGDLKGAIDQYVKTIGRLDTSYVIRKYLESRHLEPLVQYLEELHKKGYAIEDHTTLLLTCYVKLDQYDQQGKLKEFINSTNNVIEFDVDVAIKVVQQVSPDDALVLAANRKRHDWYLKIMLEDKKDYIKALEYIADLEFEDAELYMKKHGNVLIQHAPRESTDFIKVLCTGYTPRSCPLPEGRKERSSPEHFVHMFLSNSEQLIIFLDYVIQTGPDACSSLVYNALIEHYIYVWAKVESEEKKTEYEEKIMKTLRDPASNYDRGQTLIICQMHGFKPGILHLYEEYKLWRAQIVLYMSTGDWASALHVCRTRGAQCPRLWLDVLWWNAPAACLDEILNVIGNEKLLSPILVVDCLARKTNYKLGDVRKYLTNILKAESDVIKRDQELCTKYSSQSSGLRAHAVALQTAPVTFQSSRCAACSRLLELPSVHFLCQHSFHQHCFQSYSETETQCPACSTPRSTPAPTGSAEDFHGRLHNHHDAYAVISEYFGRGLFNKVKVITPGSDTVPDSATSPPITSLPVTSPPVTSLPVTSPPIMSLPATAATAASSMTYGPGAEARLRLEEGQSKLYTTNTTKQIPKSTVIVPIPESRMRAMESVRGSPSFKPNISSAISVYKPSTIITKTNQIPIPSGSPKISGSLQNPNPPQGSISSSSNPFEEEQNYDETKNPFADEEGETPKNPFDEEDDYDKNLNPFS